MVVVVMMDGALEPGGTLALQPDRGARGGCLRRIDREQRRAGAGQHHGPPEDARRRVACGGQTGRQARGRRPQVVGLAQHRRGGRERHAVDLVAQQRRDLVDPLGRAEPVEPLAIELGEDARRGEAIAAA